MPTTLPEPWFSFLKALDPITSEPTKISCLGGFAVTQHYGSARTTIDLDVIDVAPIASRNRLLEAGGKGSELAKKHRVYLDFVGIARFHTSMKTGSRKSTKVSSKISIFK